MLNLLRGKKAAPASEGADPAVSGAPGSPSAAPTGGKDAGAADGPAAGSGGGAADGAAPTSYASQATAALAAAAASDGVARPSKRPGAGRPISGADVVARVDELLPGEGSEIPVQPITVLKTDFKLAHHRQITANGSYIVYGLRAGQLRCINKSTAGRALYKGHTAPIADTAFFSPDSNLLASASTAGDLYVRLILEVDGSPLAAPVMRAALGAPPAGATARVAWHPTEPRILAAAAGGRVAMFMVPSEAAAPASEAAEQVPLDPAAPSLELALPAGRSATALAFSPSGDLLVAGDSEGGASVWVLDAAAGGGPSPAALSWSPHGGDAVSTVCFLGQPAVGEPALLVTGDATNRRLVLWRVPGAAALSGGAAAEQLQSFELASATGASDFFCHLAQSPRAQLLLLANAQRKQVHALHYGNSQGAAGDGEAFDYLATFSVKQPVLSMAAGYEMSESEATPGLMEPQVHLYCIQPDAVQQYTVDPSACLPAGEEVPLPAAAAPEVAAPAPAAAAVPAPEAAAPAAEPAVTEAAPVPPVTLPSPVRLLGKEAGSSSVKEAAASPAAARDASPPPPPLPTTLTQQREEAAPESAAAAEEKPAKGAAKKAAAEEAPIQQQQQPAKQKKGKGTGLGSLAPPAAMPPLPTTLAAKAHPDKSQLSREASATADAPPRPAVAPTVAVTPLPPGPNDDASGGGAGPGGSDDLEEGEVPPHLLASAPSASSAGIGAEDTASLRRQLNQLLAGQAALAASLRSEVSEGLRTGEAAIAARVESLVSKALSKRAEEDKRRAKEAEKAVAAQISQANAALLAAVNKSVADAAREQARAALQSASTTLAPALAPAVAAALAPQLARAAGDALSREAPAAAAAAAERAVAAALRGGALQEAVAAQFAAHVAPAVEAATRQMFGQVESAFGAWMAEARQSASASGLAGAVSQLQAVVSTLQRDLTEGQRQLVRMASSSGGGGAGGAPAAAAAPAVDPRTRVSAALAARDYDGAFNAALSAASPELLLWTCRQVSPAALAAAEPPPLSQVCLLSLVQQLGAGLGPGADAELRLDWLTEVAPLLEPSNPTIAPHLRGVLGSVMAALKALAGQLPHTDPVGRKAKLAIHVVNSLLHQ